MQRFCLVGSFLLTLELFLFTVVFGSLLVYNLSFFVFGAFLLAIEVFFRDRKNHDSHRRDRILFVFRPELGNSLHTLGHFLTKL